MIKKIACLLAFTTLTFFTTTLDAKTYRVVCVNPATGIESWGPWLSEAAALKMLHDQVFLWFKEPGLEKKMKLLGILPRRAKHIPLAGKFTVIDRTWLGDVITYHLPDDPIDKTYKGTVAGIIDERQLLVIGGPGIFKKGGPLEASWIAEHRPHRR